MNIKPPLMIHEVREEMLKLPLENYTLTFDDGLYSQYYFIEELLKFNTSMIFFVSSGIIADDAQSLEFPTCVQAHAKARSGNREDYMTLEQIRHLASLPNVSVGGHGHNHIELQSLGRLSDRLLAFNADLDLMFQWFQDNLGRPPSSFCFPYNDDGAGIYKTILARRGITEFYGRERIPIETLLSV